MDSFESALQKHVIVGDGAMGSLVARHLQGESPLATGHSILEANLTHPDVVHSIHLGYIGAGAELVTTNTFGASRARLERLGLGEHASDVVSAGVKIARDAREASGHPVWIAGSISPLDPDWLLDTGPSIEQQQLQFQ